jgi:hypothetical protein
MTDESESKVYKIIRIDNLMVFVPVSEEIRLEMKEMELKIDDRGTPPWVARFLVR